MNASIGSSLQLVLGLSEFAVELTADVVVRAWRWCYGTENGLRKLARLERAGLVTIEASGAEKIVRVTAAGRRQAVVGRDPSTQWSRPWDGLWRVVVFDVPEARKTLRTKVRRRLQGAGFGFLQNSVWISPDSCESLRQSIAGIAVDAETLTVLEARPCAGETNRDLVNGAWDFARINRYYEVYCEVVQQRRDEWFGTSAGQTEWRRWFHRESQAWERALASDPLLPEQLLPPDYRGKKAWTLRIKTRQALPGALMSLSSV